MNKSLKKTILLGAKSLGIFRTARVLSSRRLRVLAYHGIESDDSVVNRDGFHVPPAIFARQLEHISRCYRIVSLQDVITAMREGTPWPERSVLITFDDGYRNNVEVAAPLLAQQGIPAAFFVTTGFIDGTHQPWWFILRRWVLKAGFSSLGDPPGMTETPCRSDIQCLVRWEYFLKGLTEAERAAHMTAIATRLGLPPESGASFASWDQLASLCRQGHAVEPHTVSHANLGRESAADANREVTSSVMRIKEKLGIQARAFAYPYGRAEDVQPAVFDTLKQQAISVGFTTVEGTNRPETNPYLYHRLNITGRHQGLGFEKLLAMG